MLNLVEVRTAQGKLLSLPIGDDISSGYSVRNMGGLGPVKATIVSSSFASSDGEQYQSARRDSRNITMKLGIEPDYLENTVTALRKQLGNVFFVPKSQVSLRFYDDDDTTVDIQGRVESCDPDLFSNDQEVDISIINFDPDFIDVNTYTVNGTTVASTAFTTIEYPGSVETGMVFTLNVDRSITQFTIYNQPEDDQIRTLDFAASLQAGDVVTISTVQGNKYVNLSRGGVTTSLLYGMTPQSSWIELFPGMNKLRVYTTGEPMDYSLTYTPRYGSL